MMSLLAAALCVLALQAPPRAFGQFERRTFIDGTVTFTPPGVGDCPPSASDACSNYSATTGTTSEYQIGDAHVLVYNASQLVGRSNNSGFFFNKVQAPSWTVTPSRSSNNGTDVVCLGYFRFEALALLKTGDILCSSNKGVPDFTGYDYSKGKVLDAWNSSWTLLSQIYYKANGTAQTLSLPTSPSVFLDLPKDGIMLQVSLLFVYDKVEDPGMITPLTITYPSPVAADYKAHAPPRPSGAGALTSNVLLIFVGLALSVLSVLL